MTHAAGWVIELGDEIVEFEAVDRRTVAKRSRRRRQRLLVSDHRTMSGSAIRQHFLGKNPRPDLAGAENPATQGIPQAGPGVIGHTGG